MAKIGDMPKRHCSNPSLLPRGTCSFRRKGSESLGAVPLTTNPSQSIRCAAPAYTVPWPVILCNMSQSAHLASQSPAGTLLARSTRILLSTPEIETNSRVGQRREGRGQGAGMSGLDRHPLRSAARAIGALGLAVAFVMLAFPRRPRSPPADTVAGAKIATGQRRFGGHRLQRPGWRSRRVHLRPPRCRRRRWRRWRRYGGDGRAGRHEWSFNGGNGGAAGTAGDPVISPTGNGNGGGGGGGGGGGNGLSATTITNTTPLTGTAGGAGGNGGGGAGMAVAAAVAAAALVVMVQSSAETGQAATPVRSPAATAARVAMGVVGSIAAMPAMVATAASASSSPHPGQPSPIRVP